MRSKTPEEIAAMKATIRDIQMAVNKEKRVDHDKNSTQLLELFTSPVASETPPLWEIRLDSIYSDYYTFID